MGWNATRRGPAAGAALGGSVPDGAFFYFVHSYYPDPARAEDVALTSEHGLPFCAAVARDNVFACQFHPEKSQAAGLALLRHFARA
jgi:glutamine amidotransferase